MKREKTIAVSKGETTIKIVVTGVGELVLDTAKCHPDIIRHAAIHGLTQRIIDAAALERDKTTGASATPEDKFAAMKALVDHYNSGSAEWGLRTRADGGASRESSLTIRALAAVKGKPEAAIREFVDTKAAAMGIKPRELLAKLATNAEVAAKMAELRAANGPEVDVDSMLDELE